MKTPFYETDKGIAFVASSASRETSPEIMEAIAFFARDIHEAEELWAGNGFGRIANVIDIVEHVTKNGLHDASDFVWGSAGNKWAEIK